MVRAGLRRHHFIDNTFMNSPHALGLCNTFFANINGIIKQPTSLLL